MPSKAPLQAMTPPQLLAYAMAEERRRDAPGLVSQVMDELLRSPICATLSTRTLHNMLLRCALLADPKQLEAVCAGVDSILRTRVAAEKAPDARNASDDRRALALLKQEASVPAHLFVDAFGFPTGSRMLHVIQRLQDVLQGEDVERHVRELLPGLQYLRAELKEEARPPSRNDYVEALLYAALFSSHGARLTDDILDEHAAHSVDLLRQAFNDVSATAYARVVEDMPKKFTILAKYGFLQLRRPAGAVPMQLLVAILAEIPHPGGANMLMDEIHMLLANLWYASQEAFQAKPFTFFERSKIKRSYSSPAPVPGPPPRTVGLRGLNRSLVWPLGSGSQSSYSAQTPPAQRARLCYDFSDTLPGLLASPYLYHRMFYPTRLYCSRMVEQTHVDIASIFERGADKIASNGALGEWAAQVGEMLGSHMQESHVSFDSGLDFVSPLHAAAVLGQPETVFVLLRQYEQSEADFRHVRKRIGTMVSSCGTETFTQDAKRSGLQSIMYPAEDVPMMSGGSHSTIYAPSTHTLRSAYAECTLADDASCDEAMPLRVPAAEDHAPSIKTHRAIADAAPYAAGVDAFGRTVFHHLIACLGEDDGAPAPLPSAMSSAIDFLHVAGATPWKADNLGMNAVAAASLHPGRQARALLAKYVSPNSTAKKLGMRTCPPEPWALEAPTPALRSSRGLLSVALEGASLPLLLALLEQLRSHPGARDIVGRPDAVTGRYPMQEFFENRVERLRSSDPVVHDAILVPEGRCRVEMTSLTYALRLLVECGADCNVQWSVPGRFCSRTALRSCLHISRHHAQPVRHVAAEMVHVLAEGNADFDSLNEEGSGLLHEIAVVVDCEFVQIVQQYANPWTGLAKDGRGYTPLQYVVRAKQPVGHEDDNTPLEVHQLAFIQSWLDGHQHGSWLRRSNAVLHWHSSPHLRDSVSKADPFQVLHEPVTAFQ